ncbi:hypothetical protein ACFU93_29315 [Streptomyces sp. NPDC057611]|uniref:hypothetical protein n=1 Tax=Streptomyces sp. NPDC057611 TaxID=3346182 RepID=UPI0036CCD38B
MSDTTARHDITAHVLHPLLTRILKHAEQYLDGLDIAPWVSPVDPADVRTHFDEPLPSASPIR